MSTIRKSAALLKELDALHAELPNGVHPEDLADRVARLRRLALAIFSKLGRRAGVNTAEPGAGGVNATQKAVKRFKLSEIERGTVLKSAPAPETDEPAPQPTWNDLAAAFAAHHQPDRTEY